MNKHKKEHYQLQEKASACKRELGRGGVRQRESYRESLRKTALKKILKKASSQERERQK